MYSDLNKYKSEFILKFGRLMQENLSCWKEQQKKYRKKLYTEDLMYYAIAFVAGILPWKHEHDYLSNIGLHITFGIIAVIIAIIIAIDIANKEYQNEVKNTIFHELLKIFGDIKYDGATGAIDGMEKLFDDLKNHKISDEEFDKRFEDFADIDSSHSSGFLIPKVTFNTTGLFKKEINDRNDDDCFKGKYHNVDFIVDECELNYLAQQKKKDYREILFRGVAIQFNMQKEINAHIIILSKSLKNPKPNGYEKVTLEYEKFNKKYDLYVRDYGKNNGQIEARYLFNTAFLDRFMHIQTSFKVNKMWCSVQENKLLILLHTKKDLFEMNHLLGKIDDINQYKTLFNEFASVLSFIDVLNLSSKTKL